MYNDTVSSTSFRRFGCIEAGKLLHRKESWPRRKVAPAGGEVKNQAVLQVCYAYPPSFSGYGRQLSTLNDRIVTEGGQVDLRVVTCFDRLHHNAHLDEKIDIVALRNRSRKEYSDRWSLVLFCLALPTIYLHLFRRADIVHVVKAGPEAAVSVLLCRVLGKTVIVKVAQGEMAKSNRGGMLNRLARYVRQKSVLLANRIIALSASIEGDLLSWGFCGSRIIRIGNAVDGKRFAPLPIQEKFSLRQKLLGPQVGSECTVFLFLGAICQRKGVEDLLAALESLDIALDVLVAFVGPNYRDVARFESRLESVGRSGIKAVYYNETDCPESFLQAADCLILPSYSEGMPNVILEAFSSGLPVIASDIPVHKEIVKNNYGYLVEKGDAIMLAEAIKCCVLNRENLPFMGAQARNFVKYHYSPEVIANKYLTLYKVRARDS